LTSCNSPIGKSCSGNRASVIRHHSASALGTRDAGAAAPLAACGSYFFFGL
jgi:hypothetical protein